MDYFAPYRQAVSEANDIQNNNLAQAYKLHEFETKQKAAKLEHDAAKLKFDTMKRQMDLQEQARVAATEAQPTPNPEYANWQAAQFGPPKPVYDFSASKGLEEQVNAFPALAKLNGSDARLAEMKAQAPVAYTVPPAAGIPAPPQTHPANQIKTYIDTIAAQDPALAMEMKANLWEKYSKAIPPGVSEADKLEHFKSFFGDDWKYTPTKKDLMAVSKNQKIIDSAGNVVFDNTQDPTQFGDIQYVTLKNGKEIAYVVDENGKPQVIGQDAPRVHVSVGGAGGGKPLTGPALNKVLEAQDALATASGIKADTQSYINMIKNGQLELGPVANKKNALRNVAGLSNEYSQNYESFKTYLNKLRNDILTLAKGVQTEGDALRAYQVLVSNINDPAVVKSQLEKIQADNDRNARLQQSKIESIYGNFNKTAPDTSAFSNQPSVVKAAGSSKQPTVKSGRFVVQEVQ